MISMLIFYKKEYTNLFCESHFLERSLITIYEFKCSELPENEFNLSKSQLFYLSNKCNIEIKNESFYIDKV